MKNASFHMSMPCYSVSKTKDFYIDVIGAELGRNSTQWVDINLFGNQITFTKAGEFNFVYRTYKFENTVLPAFHFGVIVDKDTWNSLYEKLRVTKYEIIQEVTFLKGKLGEHTSFFIQDPNGHMLEFKTFKDHKDMFSL